MQWITAWLEAVICYTAYMEQQRLFRLQRGIYHVMQEHGFALFDIEYESVSTEQKERIFQAVLVLLDEPVDKASKSTTGAV